MCHCFSNHKQCEFIIIIIIIIDLYYTVGTSDSAEDLQWWVGDGWHSEFPSVCYRAKFGSSTSNVEHLLLGFATIGGTIDPKYFLFL